ncbi:MAG: hypothetical protein ABIO45_02985 [Burkholderiaceae bacterium]
MTSSEPDHTAPSGRRAAAPGEFSRIASRGDFHSAVRHAISQAAETGCRELWWSDADFADWPISEPAVLEDLRRWARPHRKLVLLAQGFDAVARRHPRWVDFRRAWSHVVECRGIDELDAGPMPSVLLASGLLVLRLADPVRWRGSVSRDAAVMAQTREQLASMSQRSTLAFPSTVLGV